MTTAAAAAPAKRQPMPFADRVRLHPRTGDTFKATAKNGAAFFFEVEWIGMPWVMYRKWTQPGSRPGIGYKIRLGAWRDNLAKAKIEEVKP